MRPRVIGDEALLEGLLEAFADLGFDGASVRALCRHLGVSHNLVYQRYQSKDAAWYAAVDHAFRRLERTLFEPLVATDPVEGVRELMNRYVDATIAQPALGRIIYQEASRPGPRFQHMFDEYIGPIQQRVVAAFAELQAQGVLRPGPAAGAYFFLNTWGVGGIASSQHLVPSVSAPGDDPEATARLAIDIIIDGLLAGVRPRPS